MSRCAFHKGCLALRCVFTWVNKQAERIKWKALLRLLPFPFAPTQIETMRHVQDVEIIPTWIPLQRPLSPLWLGLILLHTHTQTKLMTSLRQAQTEAALLAENNSQFSRHLRGRGGGGGWEGGKKVEKTDWELVFSSWLENNDTPGESVATWKASLFTDKMSHWALLLPPMLYKKGWHESARSAIPSRCRALTS